MNSNVPASEFSAGTHMRTTGRADGSTPDTSNCARPESSSEPYTGSSAPSGKVTANGSPTVNDVGALEPSSAVITPAASTATEFSLPFDNATISPMNPCNSVDNGVSSSSRTSVTGRVIRPKTTPSCCLMAAEKSSPGFLAAADAAAVSALRLAGAGAGVVPAAAASACSYADAVGRGGTRPVFSLICLAYRSSSTAAMAPSAVAVTT